MTKLERVTLGIHSPMDFSPPINIRCGLDGCAGTIFEGTNPEPGSVWTCTACGESMTFLGGRVSYRGEIGKTGDAHLEIDVTLPKREGGKVTILVHR